MADSDLTLEEVLAQTVWLRRLAHHLVRDEAERDDVVQEAWLEALKKSSRPRALRPWMFGLVRNVARMRLRAESRRRRHEGAAPMADAPAAPDELVERVEVERRVVAALMEIDEPYRSALLLRYYDELEPSDIARRLGVPASTVRWRIKEALDRLRVRLDREFGGDRRRWGLALIPTAALSRSGAGKLVAVTVGGLLVMKAAMKIAAAVVFAVMLFWGGSRLWRAHVAPTDVARTPAGTPWRGVVGPRGAVAAKDATLEGVTIPLWFGQRGAPIRRIAGRVTFGDAPVAGATVELASALSDAGLLPVIMRRTDPDGRFDFGSQPPARYSVAASARQHSSAVVELDTREPSSRAEHLELRLGGCEASLFGHVDDSSGGPIAGAHVCYGQPRAAACVTADDQGAYDLCLSPRQLALEVSAKGYGAVNERVLFSGRRTQRDFFLTPEATVIGRVVRVDDGRPIAGALVALAGTGPFRPRWPATASTVSGPDGRFTLSGVAPGRVRLSALTSGAATRDWIEINVQAGRTSGEILLRLATTSRVTGTVTDGEDPVSGATIAFLGAMRSDAVTQTDGSFVLDNVPRGKQVLQVVTYDVREPKTLVVDRDQVDDVRVVVRNMGSIAGRVTRSGTPFAGAEVSAGPNLSTFTDEDGHYILRGLPAGKYHLTASSQVAGAFGKPPAIALGSGEQRDGVDIEMQWAGSISGTIVESNGAPAAGVYVRFEAQHLSDGGDDTTAPDGSFRVATLMGGDDYRPFVRPSQRSNQKFAAADGDFPAVHVADGASSVTDVHLVIKRAHLAIAGAVVDGDGQPVPDVHVAATRSDGEEPGVANPWGDTPAAISAADGSFRIDDLDTGTYLLDAHGNDGSEATAQNIAAGATGVVIKLQAAGGIDGVLVGFATRPSVRAWRQGVAGAIPEYATGSDNAFSIRGLPAGQYVVSTLGTGGDAQTVDVQSGQIASTTLRNRGVATVKGHVFDWRTGAPVAAMRCEIGMRANGSAPSWDASNVAISDADGHFTLEGVAAGSIAVGCKVPNIFITDGAAAVVVGEGQLGHAEIPVLERNQESSPGHLGAALDMGGFLTAQVIFVEPRGPADRAGLRVGDTIVSVDGKSVTSLSPYAVQSLITDRGPGQAARLGLLRGDAATNVSVMLGPPLAY